jgi:HEAT repeat protein
MPLLKDPNPRVCGRAIVYLCAFDYGEAQPEIVELLLHHHVTSVRETAAVTLRNMKSEPACEALIQALSHKDQRIVYSAANSLAVLHCTDAIQPLVQFSKQDPLRFIPGLAAMGAIGGPEAKAALKELFSRGDTPAPIKVATAFELAKMGDEEAHQFLREQADHFVKKEPTLLTEESAHTLAEMKDYSAVPMLINLMKESRWQGGYSYGEILTELTGKYYGWDVQRWQEWWDKNKDEFLSPTSKT